MLALHILNQLAATGLHDGVQAPAGNCTAWNIIKDPINGATDQFKGVIYGISATLAVFEVGLLIFRRNSQKKAESMGHLATIIGVVLFVGVVASLVLGFSPTHC